MLIRTFNFLSGANRERRCRPAHLDARAEVLAGLRRLLTRWQHLLALAAIVVESVGYAILRSLGPLPMWVDALIVVVLAVQAANYVLTAVHLVFASRPSARGDNDVVNGAFATVGAVFALLLGFVTVVVWESYSETEQTVSQEANAVADIERMSRGFPVSVQRQVQGAARSYLELVIGEEWPQLPAGRSSERAYASIVELWDVYTNMDVGLRSSPLYSQSIIRLNELGDARRGRLIAASAGIPAVMWVMLYAGGGITIFMSLLFKVKNRVLQRVLITFMVSVTTFSFFLIHALESPFDDQVPIEPAPFAQVLDNMRQLET